MSTTRGWRENRRRERGLGRNRRIEGLGALIIVGWKLIGLHNLCLIVKAKVRVITNLEGEM